MAEQMQGLTPTEIVVADLAGRGSRDEEIARELDIDAGAVAEHLAQVRRKLGLEPGVSLANEATRRRH